MLNKLKRLATMNYQDLLAYRGDVLIYTSSSFVLPLVLMAVWISISESNPSSLLSKNYIVQYFFWQMLISVLIGAWHAVFFARDVREGKLSMSLLKPFPRISYDIMENISEKAFKLTMAIPTYIIIGILLRHYISIPSFTTTILFLFSIVFAACINFLMEHIIAVCVFWFSDISALDSYNEMLFFLFSGKLFPLIYVTKIIPSWVLNILPYRYIISFPLDILLRNPQSIDIAIGFIAQIMWIILCYCVYRFLWAKGLRIYGAYGG